MGALWELVFDVLKQATESITALKEEVLCKKMPRNQKVTNAQVQECALDVKKENIG